MVFVSYYQDIFSSKHKRKYSFLYLEFVKYSKPLRSIYKAAQLPNVAVISKRFSWSSKLSPSLENTLKITMARIYSVKSSKNSKPIGRQHILPFWPKIYSSKNTRSSVSKPKTKQPFVKHRPALSALSLLLFYKLWVSRFQQILNLLLSGSS